MPGRPKTTGRFATRQELCDKVHDLWAFPKTSVALIARNCEVSDAVVSKIIDTGEGKTVDPLTVWRIVGPDLVRGKMPGDPKETPNVPYERIVGKHHVLPDPKADAYWKHYGYERNAPIRYG
jgi:hypothetical protein